MGKKRDFRLKDEDVEKFKSEEVAKISSDDKFFGEVDFKEIRVGFKKEYKDKKTKEEVEEEEKKIIVAGIVPPVVSEEIGKLDLEEVLLGEEQAVVAELPQERREEGSFYETKESIGSSYSPSVYDTKSSADKDLKVDRDESVELREFKNFVDVEDERRLGRSGLEIAGFKDEEAEKKRKERKRFLGY